MYRKRWAAQATTPDELLEAFAGFTRDLRRDHEVWLVQGGYREQGPWKTLAYIDHNPRVDQRLALRVQLDLSAPWGGHSIMAWSPDLGWASHAELWLAEAGLIREAALAPTAPYTVEDLQHYVARLLGRPYDAEGQAVFADALSGSDELLAAALEGILTLGWDFMAPELLAARAAASPARAALIADALAALLPDLTPGIWLDESFEAACERVRGLIPNPEALETLAAGVALAGDPPLAWLKIEAKPGGTLLIVDPSCPAAVRERLPAGLEPAAIRAKGVATWLAYDPRYAPEVAAELADALAAGEAAAVNAVGELLNFGLTWPLPFLHRSRAALPAEQREAAENMLSFPAWLPALEEVDEA